MRSSSAIGQVYVRSPEEGRERDRADPDGRCEEDVHEHEPPGQMCAPLQLTEPHLREQHHEEGNCEREEWRRTVTTGTEVAQAEEERAEEDADDGAVRV